MSRLVTTVVGAVAEAWGEVRVHRGRVVLSLVGVTVAVASLTAVVGFGDLTAAALQATNERYGGRPATYSLTVEAERDAVPVDPVDTAAAFHDALDRHGIRAGAVVEETERRVQLPDGVRKVRTQVVDRAWGDIHDNGFADGDWFRPGDEDRLAPAVIVNERLWESIGSPAVDTHPTVRIGADADGRPRTVAVLVGVTDTASFETEPEAILLRPAGPPSAEQRAAVDPDASAGYEMWLPPRRAESLADRVASDMERDLGGTVTVDTLRTDASGQQDGDGLESLRVMVIGASVLVLVLGAVGLLGISLVSVRQRIRDIGIRRGVGATAPRIFVAVMLENVVGTAVAGGIGVMVGALLMGLPLVRESITFGLPIALPPFPLSAAVTGMVCSVSVGALSGLVPALVAVRVRVIDAIRT